MNFNNFQNINCKVWEKGVDINRNFDYNYGIIQSSEKLCGEQYRGSKPFS